MPAHCSNRAVHLPSDSITDSGMDEYLKECITLMGSISVACYKPRPGCEEALLELVRNHLPPLRAQGLVTDALRS